MRGWGVLLCVLGGLGAMNVAAADHPEELGQVAWLRDYADAQKAAKASGKPILILFMEVPG
ncbi:MAG: hypothetical protein KIS92_13430 [Planctomycetota bacterium]|nr:hypothetical protein [Planctomycetota bacterium]